MIMSSESFPETDTLTRVLTSCLGDDAKPVRLTIAARRRNPYASTAAMEIVTCRLETGGELSLLCKYGSRQEHGGGHRGGVAYEAMVYRHLIGPLALRPRYLGSYVAPDSGATWLFTEYLGDRLRVSKGPYPESMRSAAQWIGRFHRLNATRVGQSDLSFLRNYDAAYYASWASRTYRFAGALRSGHPWLADVCERAPELLAVLAEGPQTIIHGEYYPQNIICADDGVCAVDWESAAIGPGEIDLASLTSRWESAEEQEMVREYQLARGTRRDIIPDSASDSLPHSSTGCCVGSEMFPNGRGSKEPAGIHGASDYRSASRAYRMTQDQGVAKQFVEVRNYMPLLVFGSLNLSRPESDAAEVP